MVIGVPKEIKDHEYRVSVTPDGVRALRQAGHAVWIEPSAGVGSGYSDEDYRSAGGTMAESKTQLFHQATLIVKVGTAAFRVPLFPSGQTLYLSAFGFLADLTKALLDTTITAIA
jgi:alanine dehydrogenase